MQLVRVPLFLHGGAIYTMFLEGGTGMSNSYVSSRFINLAKRAICRIFLSILTDPSTRKDLPYMGMACGFFGKLALEESIPFAEVMELSRVAHRVTAKKKQVADG